VGQIKDQTGNASVEYIVADLSVQQEIKKLAEGFQKRHQHLHVLINNAGAINFPRRESADGIEMTFALNHLAYFSLTLLLLDTLKASAPARIINVASDAHRGSGINLDDLEGRHKYRGFGAYSHSKLANIMFTYELARRLTGTGVTVNALHPGLVATNFLSNNGIRGQFLRIFLPFMGMTPERGADTPVYLASSPDVATASGYYFVKRLPEPSSAQSYDEDAALGLWQASLQLTGLNDAPQASAPHPEEPDSEDTPQDEPASSQPEES
jgi:NAD(P)-dependent dehydrogenase (short-subunit alcohol dehydrogenase family)